MIAKISMNECRDDRKRYMTVALPVEFLKEFEDVSKPPAVAGERLSPRWGYTRSDRPEYRFCSNGAYHPMSEKEEQAIKEVTEEIRAAVQYLKERKMYGKREIIIPLDVEEGSE